MLLKSQVSKQARSQGSCCHSPDKPMAQAAYQNWSLYDEARYNLGFVRLSDLSRFLTELRNSDLTKAAVRADRLRMWNLLCQNATNVVSEVIRFPNLGPGQDKVYVFMGASEMMEFASTVGIALGIASGERQDMGPSNIGTRPNPAGSTSEGAAAGMMQSINDAQLRLKLSIAQLFTRLANPKGLIGVMLFDRATFETLGPHVWRIPIPPAGGAPAAAAGAAAAGAAAANANP
uniref:Uncharacterized protein n=1 Tax=Fern benyvirus TaxID=2933169 RepID=A0A9C7GWR3_9VIRU|nr:hypothetical protein 1 [Fern benyvirus]CAI5383953.1 hypothetical protein 1 [Fern benyvirus]